MLSIFDCWICQKIPQKVSLDNSDNHSQPWPLTEHQLRFLDQAKTLKKCPECGTLYTYVESFDAGEAMVMASTTTALVRLTPHMATWRVTSLLAKEPREAGLQQEVEVLADHRVAALVRFAASIATVSAAPWQLKKHAVESLTDEALMADDWGILQKLLQSPDPVVRVETARDFLFIAAEEFSVWCVRPFTADLKRHAQLLLAERSHVDELMVALGEGLAHREQTFRMDSIWGWRETTVASTALNGLSYGNYHHMDIRRGVPALVTWLRDTGENPWMRKQARVELSTYVKGVPERARLVLDAIGNAKEQPAESIAVVKTCRRLAAKSTGTRTRRAPRTRARPSKR